MSKAWLVLGNFTYLLAHRTLCSTRFPVTVSLGPRTTRYVSAKMATLKALKLFPCMEVISSFLDTFTMSSHGTHVQSCWEVLM